LKSKSIRYITSGSRGGGRTPNGRGPMIFYVQNANFSQFVLRSLRSSFILSIILIEIWPKHAKNNFNFNFQHFHEKPMPEANRHTSVTLYMYMGQRQLNHNTHLIDQKSTFCFGWLFRFYSFFSNISRFSAVFHAGQFTYSPFLDRL